MLTAFTKETGAQVIDHSLSDAFAVSDFKDTHHLTDGGAIRYSQMLAADVAKRCLGK